MDKRNIQRQVKATPVLSGFIDGPCKRLRPDMSQEVRAASLARFESSWVQPLATVPPTRKARFQTTPPGPAGTD
jgi:hypothetical protein